MGVRMIQYLPEILRYNILAHINFESKNQGSFFNPATLIKYDGGEYRIQNDDPATARHTHISVPLHHSNNFLITCCFGFTNDCNSHFGIVWGFDKTEEYLNRFTISASDHFQLSHYNGLKHVSIRQFRGKINKGSRGGTNEVNILKINGLYFFYANDHCTPLFQCLDAQFPVHGSRVGFYAGPGVHVKPHQFIITRLECEGATGLDISQLVKSQMDEDGRKSDVCRNYI